MRDEGAIVNMAEEETHAVQPPVDVNLLNTDKVTLNTDTNTNVKLDSALDGMESVYTGLSSLWVDLKSAMDNLESVKDDLDSAKGDLQFMRFGTGDESEHSKKRMRLDEYGSVSFKVKRQ